MPHFINDSGTWKESTVYVNDGGVWKEPTSIQVNDAGTWKEVYPTASMGALDSFENWPSGTGRNDMPEGWTMQFPEGMYAAGTGLYRTDLSVIDGSYAIEIRLAETAPFPIYKDFDLTNYSTLYLDITFMVEHQSDIAMFCGLDVGSSQDLVASFYPATSSVDVSSLTGIQEVKITAQTYATNTGDLYDPAYSYSIVRFDNLRGD